MAVPELFSQIITMSYDFFRLLGRLRGTRSVNFPTARIVDRWRSYSLNGLPTPAYKHRGLRLVAMPRRTGEYRLPGWMSPDGAAFRLGTTDRECAGRLLNFPTLLRNAYFRRLAGTPPQTSPGPI